MGEPIAECEACNAPLYDGDKFRTDGNGFTGCMPCFPISDHLADERKFKRGPCYHKRLVAKRTPPLQTQGEG